MANIDYDDITERLVQSNKTTSEEGASIILGQCKSYISSRKSNGKKPTFKNLSVLRNVCEEWIQEFHDEIRESELGVVSADEWNDAKIIWELQNDLMADIQDELIAMKSKNNRHQKRAWLE